MDTISAITTTLVVFGWVLGLSLLGLIIFFVVVYFKYNILFRVRGLTASGNKCFDDKAKVVKNKKGQTIGWKLLKRKDVVPVPPPEAIDINQKGKLTVEAFYTPEGQYVYIKANREVEVLDPLTSDDKSFYASQYRDSLKFKSIDWTGIITIATSGAVLIVVLVLALIFVKDLFLPAKEVSSILVNAIESAKSCGVTYNMTGVFAP